MRDNFYIITGGPGAGKTALLRELSKYKVLCVPEVARQIIREQVEQAGRALPWDDAVQYKELMLQRSIEEYLRIDTRDRPVFFDRGIPDALAYARLIGDVSPAVIAEQYRCNRDVFILPPWEEIYQTDSERKQTFQEAVDVCRRLEKEYTKHKEIIHPDFVCIESDGSIVNREEYLKNWATDFQRSGYQSIYKGAWAMAMCAGAAHACEIRGRLFTITV